MRRAQKSSSFLLLLMLLLFPVTSFAEQIQIVDSGGLTRAIRKVHSGALATVEVVVELANPSLKSEISLVQVDGTSREKLPVQGSASVLRFSEVGQGVWRIKSSAKGVTLRKVQILLK